MSALRSSDRTAVAGAVGQSLGRVGCFLVGDDYGVVTDVPWAVSFPQGAPLRWRVRATAGALEVRSFEGRVRPEGD